MKKVSLILTTYNSKDNLEKTLSSIEIQDYPNIEVVIKDGGSTDGTLDIIREYQEKSELSIISVSKPDKGIYDAMNQGYELSSGDVIVCFNDVFAAPDVISKMIKKMETINPDTGEEYVGAHADLVYVDGDKVIRKWHMGEGNIYQGWMPGHPTMFLKREIYEKYGLYRTDFKIAADYEFMVRFLKDKANKLAYLPETVIEMFYGGTSTVGLMSYIESFKEGYKALKINGIAFAFWITGFRTLRVLGQFK
ncbi:MAG: glycosyltransferase [Lachnospiraceae bacterium]|nr:glycosyltransferase [Lachnospiraceae bacterium]